MTRREYEIQQLTLAMCAAGIDDQRISRAVYSYCKRLRMTNRDRLARVSLDARCDYRKACGQ